MKQQKEEKKNLNILTLDHWWIFILFLFKYALTWCKATVHSEVALPEFPVLWLGEKHNVTRLYTKTFRRV